jgi:hypothetical protein
LHSWDRTESWIMDYEGAVDHSGASRCAILVLKCILRGKSRARDLPSDYAVQKSPIQHQHFLASITLLPPSPRQELALWATLTPPLTAPPPPHRYVELPPPFAAETLRLRYPSLPPQHFWPRKTPLFPLKLRSKPYFTSSQRF